MSKKKTVENKTKRKFTVIFSYLVVLACGIFFGRLTYDINWNIFKEPALCMDGTQPDKHGCCSGEIYTDMGELGFNCCPETGGDCFPPIR